MEALAGGPDVKELKTSKFISTLSQIQSTTLTPENIDRYASSALNRLVILADNITLEYTREKDDQAFGKELEDNAFTYFGLGNIGEILDHVAAKELEIEKIGEIIEKAQNIGTTIVPPSGEMKPIQEGDGSFAKKEIISRTKTLLFILANDFDINLDDPEQVSVKTGILSDNMMRKLSYFMIDVPKIKRTILVCDEEGNVTYVFDREALNTQGISPEDLTHLTKPDINDLLESDSSLGRRVMYTKMFIPRIIELISDTNAPEELTHGIVESRNLYLYPKAPQEVLSIRGLSEKLEIDSKPIKRAIQELGDSLGAIQTYRFGVNATEGYTPEQQEMITSYLERKNLFSSDASEEIISLKVFSKRFGVSARPILKAIDELGEELGEIKMYKFKTIVARGLNPYQQELLKVKLKEMGNLSEYAPEGISSLWDIARRLGIGESKKTVTKAVKKLGENLGEVKRYRFGNKIMAGYTPEQQAMIEQYLKYSGALSEAAPEGVLSMMGVANKFGVTHATIEKAAERLKDSLGETNLYKFQSKTVVGFTPQQQAIFEQYLQDTGALSEAAPEGIVSVKNLVDRFHISDKTLNAVIGNLGDRLGKIRTYRFSSVYTRGFTPEQQEIIAKELEKENKILVHPPEGVLSENRLAKKLGVSFETIKATVEKLGEALGNLDFYKFRNTYARGLSPEQQEIIKKALKEKGFKIKEDSED